MRRVIICQLAAVMMSLIGCGSESSSGDASPDKDLIGEWQTACYGEEVGNGSLRNFKRDKLVISSASFVTTTWFYPVTDRSCESAQYSTEISSSYQLGMRLQSVVGARAIDIRPYKTQVRPEDTETAAIFSKQPDSYCELTDWVAGVARDVTERSCAKKSSVIYDIYQRENGNLVFGYAYGEDIGSNPELRPKTLDRDRVFTKV